MSLELGLYLATINLTTYIAYWLDKRASIAGNWRIAESTLHGIALIGGSPAAYYAQKHFRHKTQKTSFQRTFWGIVALQCVGVIGVYWYNYV